MEYRLAIYSLAIHVAALFFGVAAFFLAGLTASIIVFFLAVAILLGVVYWRTTRTLEEENKNG